MKKVFTLMTLMTLFITLFAAGALRMSAEENGTTTVWFLNSEGWTDINAYAFPDDPLGGWPGTPATQDGDTDWWSVDVVLADPFNIIFNGEGGQTADIPLLNDTDVYITVLGEKFATREAAEASLDAEREPTTVWFLNSNGWTDINAFAFPDDPLGGWPGTAATQDGETDWWSVDVIILPGVKIIFNGEGGQTGDIELVNETDVYLTVRNQRFDSREAAEASLEEPEPEAPRKVIVHYHRWDGDYEGRTVWTWNTGWSEPPIYQGEPSDFGTTFEIGIGDTAGDEIGLILRYGDGWGNGHNDRDGWIPADGGDKENKAITIRDDEGEFVGFDEDGIKHVFVYEGSNEVIYQDDYVGPLNEGFGTLAVIYFDPTQEYEDWNIWNWGVGSGGTSSNAGPFVDTGVAFQGNLGVDGQSVNDPYFKVAHFQIAPDADDLMGFIVRTDGWAKQCEEDLFIDISDVQGEGFKTVFYMANSCEFIETFEEFEAEAFAFVIETLQALDPLSISLGFNKPIRIRLAGEDIFTLDWFTLTDKDGNVIPIENASFVADENSTNGFTLILNQASPLRGDASPYTLVFDNGDEMLEDTFEIPSTPPTISIAGARTVNLEVGDVYVLPTFSATEHLADSSVPLYNVRVKEGSHTVDTRNAGVYQIVIIAVDRFSNVTEETITVTVIDPCAIIIDNGDAAGCNGQSLGNYEDMSAMTVFARAATLVLPLIAVISAGAFIKMRRGQ
ncbi:MAG: starch-binding protein [Acholeplasmatales bacterium]|nr:MAG: starch-binding protein [Acholeplasmatales bacterium]